MKGLDERVAGRLRLGYNVGYTIIGCIYSRAPILIIFLEPLQFSFTGSYMLLLIHLSRRTDVRKPLYKLFREFCISKHSRGTYV